jgi:acyl-coenzyme A synthetase/AMP-(fatty) acid ligase
MIAKMLALPGAAGRDLSSLRATVSAGEALPEELYHRWKATYGSEILDGIGSAELFHIYISNHPDDVRPGTLGRVVPGYEARIVGDDGRELGPGEIGSLWVKGDSAAVCYFQAHELSKAVLRGDWVVSGDRFSRDADGTFRYGGRADDLLKVGGVFVAPVEVERVLMEHPAVVLRDGFAAGAALADELVALARARLALHKVPRRVEFVAALPRSDRGKLVRREVR